MSETIANIYVDTDSAYPGYGVIDMRGLWVPVMLAKTPFNYYRVADAWMDSAGGVRAFDDVDEAWEFVAREFIEDRERLARDNA